MTRRIRVAVVAGGRSSEHEISLASARSVLEALDPERYETTTIAIGRDGRWALGAGEEQACSRETVPTQTLPVPRGLEAGGRDRLRRRRPARPARPVRRGRHRSGPAGAGERAVRGSGRRGVRALHGQGPLQGRAPRPRDPGRSQRDAAPRRRDREPVRLPRLRQAGAARLVGRDLEGPRRGGARDGGRARAAARREGAGRGVRRRNRGRVRRARQPAAGTASPPSSARSSRTASGTTTRPSTTRTARTSSSRPGSRTRPRRAFRSSPSTRSSRPSARAWPASTSSCARTGRSS